MARITDCHFCINGLSIFEKHKQENTRKLIQTSIYSLVHNYF